MCLREQNISSHPETGRRKRDIYIYNILMNKRIITAALACLSFLSGCAADVSTPHEKLSFWIVPDLHFLSESLYDENSASFQYILSTNDGKMIEQMPEILEALKTEALAQHPDLILFPGDLTFNGEYQSLLDLRECLREIQSAGIKVLVIPGNHDIAYPSACDLSGDEPITTKNISQNDFTETMKEFGYENSISHADDSFSYTFEVSDDLWITALDANTEKAPGSLTEETLAWAEKQLNYSSKHKIRVITMTHQNILKQNELLYQGFIVNNAGTAAKILKQYGVTLNLSGHSHLQHTAVSGTLKDICTESSALYPLGFGIISVDADHRGMTYTKQLFDVSQTEAEKRLNETLNRQIMPFLKEKDIPQEKAEAMAAFASEVNLAYFTGSLSDSSSYEKSEEWKYWQQYAGDSFWYLYLQQILQETAQPDSL